MLRDAALKEVRILPYTMQMFPFRCPLRLPEGRSSPTHEQSPSPPRERCCGDPPPGLVRSEEGTEGTQQEQVGTS